jgi:hypothetical protein
VKETRPEMPCDTRPRLRPASALRLVLPALLMHSGQALASGSMEDKIADVMVWVVIVVAPILALTVFWILHVWPERVALARDHPQKEAIQALCLMSLVFGGMLWPLAMLWAYMKPLRFRLEPSAIGVESTPQPAVPEPCPPVDANVLTHAPVEEEIVFLRHRIEALQGRLDVLVERDSSTLHG